MNPRRYVICDIEATGLNEECEIIEIALITYQDEQITEIYETLINPLRNISDYIQDLTAISPKELQHAPKFYEVADAIRMRLEGSVFVSHNTEFDLGLLKKKFQEMGQELKVKNFCTLSVAQHEIPGLRSYSLDALCSFFGIKITDRHRALGDAKATLILFKELFNLRMKIQSRPLYLPHHEKQLKDIPARAGLLSLKNVKGKVIHFAAAFNMQKSARSLLEAKPIHRDLLIRTDMIEAEITGSALIAEFKKLLFEPYRPHWVITIQDFDSGEKHFKIRPYKKGLIGLWYFSDYLDAKARLKMLDAKLKEEKFAYRDGGKSKEEILKHNQKVKVLAQEARFPSENLIILGEGRTRGEKSLILVRNGHVLGYGYTSAPDEEIYENPEVYLARRFFQHLGVNLATMNYIRVLKNLKHKSDTWRSLAELP